MSTYTHAGEDRLRNEDGNVFTLSELMDFDHVIRVTVPEGGGPATVEDVDEHAPGAYCDADGEDWLDDSDRWEWASAGYTGQYGYSGPVMHASELIGGRLAEDILSTPGTYAAVVVTALDDEGDSEDEPAGWAVVKMREDVRTFRTTTAAGTELGTRNGQTVTIVRAITEPDETHDAESLPMYVVRFPDGETAEVWGDELR